MKILITGGSGFLGQRLSMALLNSGHQIIWVSQNPSDITPPKNISVIDYQTLRGFKKPVDVIINLAGAGIADKRWSKTRKSELLNSRILPTQAVLTYINQLDTKPKLLISSSALGYYGTAKHSVIFDEHSKPNTEDFASKLCQTWETLALTANTQHVAIIRTGVVLDNHGGMLKRLLPAFKLGLGGRLGTGEQSFSWISVRDWVNAIIFIIQKNINSTLPAHQFYNLTNPNAMTNHNFTLALGQLLKRPTLCHLPSWLIKLLFGEMAILLIDGQHVYPKQLLELGFTFYDNDLSFLKTS